MQVKKIEIKVEYPRGKAEDKISALLIVDKVQVNVAYGFTLKQALKRVFEDLVLYVEDTPSKEGAAK